ncbi:TSUP family transporter [Rhodovulum sp. DZ06]|uniref:TSUP family transporter n=1 Tax=Rhodovulum sp. DZ06 TaxID=3425126 RepID=UPI003D350951
MEFLPDAQPLILTAAAVFAAAVLRGITGFGFALAAAPLLSLFLEPQAAVTSVILLQVLAGVKDMATIRADADWGALRRLGAGALFGVPVGTALLAWADPALMRLLIAAAVMLGLAILLLAPGHRGDPGREALPAGVLSGLFGGLAGMAGPPAVAFFMRAGTPAATARASLMLFFFFTSLMALPGLWAGGLLGAGPAALSLCAFPALLAGTWAGGRIFKRTSENGWRRLALASLGVMALAAGARGAAELLA